MFSVMSVILSRKWVQVSPGVTVGAGYRLKPELSKAAWTASLKEAKVLTKHACGCWLCFCFPGSSLPRAEIPTPTPTWMGKCSQSFGNRIYLWDLVMFAPWEVTSWESMAWKLPLSEYILLLLYTVIDLENHIRYRVWLPFHIHMTQKHCVTCTVTHKSNTEHIRGNLVIQRWPNFKTHVLNYACISRL